MLRMPQLNVFAITTLSVSATASLVAWQALKRIQYVGPDEQVSTAHHGGNSLPQTAHHGEQLASARTAMHHLTIGVLQVLLKRLTDKVVVNGPTVFFPSPLTTLSYKKRKGISLTALQCGCPLPSSMGARRACSELAPAFSEMSNLTPCGRAADPYPMSSIPFFIAKNHTRYSTVYGKSHTSAAARLSGPSTIPP